MDNMTNSPAPQLTPSPTPHGHKNWIVLLIFIVVAVIVGVLLAFHFEWAEYLDVRDLNLINTNRQETSFDGEVEAIDVGDLDAEFLDIEKDLNSL